MADQDQDRTEDATPHKLREAQKRGQVAKSQEAVFAAILGALVLVCFGAGPGIAQREAAQLRRIFTEPLPGDWSADGMAHWVLGDVTHCLTFLLPLLLALVCAAVAANIAQTGGVFSFEPLSPDFSRINPATGLKRLFSLRAIYDAGRSTLKMAVLATVAWLAIDHALPDLIKLGYVEPHAHAAVTLGLVSPLLFKLLMAIVVLAAIDFAYTRFDFARKMRMSKREVKDEYKQREGDPRIRARLRQLRAQMLKQSQSVRKLPEADVLLTNPTHVAVALSYRHGEMPAPKLIAKGAGSLAAKMRETARKHGVPVIENRPLARALYKRTDLDHFVPEDIYPQVAKILVWVYALRQARQQKGAAACMR